MRNGRMKARPEDWPRRLVVWQGRVTARPFAWGAWDCALLAADWVMTLHGLDFAADLRGRYGTPRGAARALDRIGAGGLDATVTAALGPPLIGHNFAQRGDIAALKSDETLWAGPMLGVVVGAQVVVAGSNGSDFRPLASVLRYWET